MISIACRNCGAFHSDWFTGTDKEGKGSGLLLKVTELLLFSPYVNSHEASSRRKHQWWNVVLNTESDLVSHWVLMSFILQHGYNIAYFRVILQGSLMHVMMYSKICVLDQQNIFFFLLFHNLIHCNVWSEVKFMPLY